MTIKYVEKGTDYGGDTRTLGSCTWVWGWKGGWHGKRNEFLEVVMLKMRSEKSGGITVAEIGSWRV